MHCVKLNAIQDSLVSKLSAVRDNDALCYNMFSDFLLFFLFDHLKIKVLQRHCTVLTFKLIDR